jgi:hypothetical protein
MLHLQDQFLILQSGLVDFIDHLATSFPQSDLKGVEEDDTASDEVRLEKKLPLARSPN